MRNLLISLLIVTPIILTAQDKVSNYIILYKDIAVNEMHRSGIPASITLAQGMFESGYGLSSSAQNFNNHFGIKCKKDWQGSYYFKEDDDRDKEGNLIASCFRAYSSVADSYEDHTNFLVERPRYAELFSFQQTDYQNWALGLERCGYATNPMYAERLIEIIEKYNLWEFDGHIFANQEIEVKSEVVNPVDDLTENEPTEIIAATVIDETPVIKDSSISAEPVDTIALLRIVVNREMVRPTQNRINQAIILPSNYQRKVTQTQTVTDFR